MQVEKVIGSLPDPLAPDTIYAVRTGAGFDLRFTDSTGSVAHTLNLGSGGAASFDAMRVFNTDTTTNINTGSLTEIPFGGEFTFGSGFTRVGNAIRTDFDGAIELCGSVYMATTTVQRSGVACEYFLNGASLGPRFNTSYIRRASNHNEASCACIAMPINCADGDLFALRGIQEAAGGTVTMNTAARSFLYAKRVA